MRTLLIALAFAATTGLATAPAAAAPCKDAKGKFVKCQTAEAKVKGKDGRCRIASGPNKGAFTKC